jgi:hypothetical protein
MRQELGFEHCKQFRGQVPTSNCTEYNDKVLLAGILIDNANLVSLWEKYEDNISILSGADSPHKFLDLSELL